MMTEGRRYALNAQLDIDQILSEAQHRWLRPAEICEILQNYKHFQIAQEPPNRPPGGSLFLFDRKVLRYFRKDGHNWRKKRDGKTVKEAHEKLKSGSVDVLHCYYAHGEEDEFFQRRSYWMLEEELSHIVLVHYREVKGNRSNFSRLRDSDGIPLSQKIEDNVSYSDVRTSGSSRTPPYDYQGTSQITDTTSLSSIQASEYEDAESAYRHQASPGLHPIQESPSPTSQMVEVGSALYYTVPTSSSYQGQISTIPGVSFESTSREKNTNVDNGLSYQFQQDQAFQSWENASERTNTSYQSFNFQPSFPSTQSSPLSKITGDGNELLDQVVTGLFGQRQGLGSHSQQSEEQQASDGELSNWSVVQNSDLNEKLGQNPHYLSLSRPLLNHNTKLNDVNKVHLASAISLQKLDSFDRWISKELDDVTNETIHPNSSVYWDSVGNVDGDGSDVPLDNYILGPSISNDQLFTIEDFSPNWAFSGTEIKVLVMGKFLKSQEELQNCTWACMFGELEVPAKIVANGVLQCYTPSHENGRVPFYVTCSNRLSCSEVREFEFRPIQDTDIVDAGSIISDEALYMRFRKLLSLEPNTSQTPIQGSSAETSQLCSINAMCEDDLKEQLHIWLLQKLSEGGKGPSILDEGGQGVLHFAAALGYDWAIPPIIDEGVNINFRDANGWTALHWAAFHGRERTVGLLISLGAAPGFVTDPTPKYPSGRPPADLAAANGHKGIAGYLAESSLSSHLSSITLKGSEGSNQGTSVATVSEQAVSYGPQGQSMKHSLTAVRNAVQAVSRIQEVYRVQSFQRKQLKEYGDREVGISDDRALSLLALRTKKPGHRIEPVHAAAVRIQNKFRSYKDRKDYLLIRQQIIKIQAHVRGHQVRKNYRKIIWSVGLLDKIILRWRRKGRGLSGFKPDARAASSSAFKETQEDEYDYLKEGRKQTEVRLEKALARVKSMVQYPEARDQYHRVMNAVSEMQEKKAAYDHILNNPEVDFDDALLDIDALLEDDGDTFM